METIQIINTKDITSEITIGQKGGIGVTIKVKADNEHEFNAVLPGVINTTVDEAKRMREELQKQEEQDAGKEQNAG